MVRENARDSSIEEDSPRGASAGETVREVRRPFRPVDPSEPTTPAFALRPLAERLRHENAFREHGRDAVTLVHRPDLTAVLSVLAKGRTIDDNRRVPGPALLVVLSGRFELRREGQETVVLEAETMATVAPEVDHVLVAQEDSALLLVIGAQW
jgi:quercetin dioxygenase-like cupin family protein